MRFLRLMPRGSCPGLNRTVMRLTSAGRGWQHPPMSAARLAGGRQPTAQVMCLDVKADRGSTAIRREGCSWVTKATAAPYRPNFAPATLIGQGRLCSGFTTRPNIGYEQSQQLDSKNIKRAEGFGQRDVASKGEFAPKVVGRWTIWRVLKCIDI